LAPPGYDFREVATWLAARTNFPFVDRTSHTTAPDWYRMLTIGLTEKRLIAMLIGQALRSRVAEKASADQIVSLAAACGTASEDAASWFPHLDLVAPAPPAPLELWNASDPLSADALGMWLSREHPFGKRSDDDLATALLDTMASSESAHLLAPLLFHLDVRRLNLPTADRVRNFLNNASITGAFEPNGGAMQRLLSIEARLRAEIADEAGMQSFLVREAKRAAERWRDITVTPRGGDSSSAALEMIMEAAAEFSFALRMPMAEQFRAFAECGRVVADAWPRAAQAVLALLDSAVGVGDTESSGALWPVLLDLRTRP
jgi:hypothetical protein